MRVYLLIYQIIDYYFCILFLETTLSTIVSRHEGKKGSAEKSYTRNNDVAGMSSDMGFSMFF